MNLLKKIDLWCKEGIINSEQKEAIVEFENKAKKPKLLYMLWSLAIFCIGVGCISLIASNWADIPVSLKLFIDFSALVGIAYKIFDANKKGNVFIKESFILLYAIMIVATIGLVAQIYHLESNGYSAALFWSAMVAPLFYITKKSVLPFLWFFIFNYATFSLLFIKYPYFLSQIEAIYRQSNLLISACYILMITFIASITYNKYKEKITHLTTPVFIWSIILLFMEVIYLEFRSNWWYYAQSSSMMTGVATSILALFIILITLIYLFKKHDVSYIYATILILYSFSLLPGDIKLLSAISTFSILALIMVYSYKKSSYKLFNFAGALVAIRIFVVYIQLFGSLLTTGLGLVISGIVLIIIAKIWHKMAIKANNKFKEKNGEG